MFIRAIIKDLLGEFTGPRKKLLLGYLGLAVLFLVYIYAGKDVFLTGNGYGLPQTLVGTSVAAGRKAADLQQALQRETAPDRRVVLEGRLAAARRDAAATGNRRTLALRFLRYAGWFASGFLFLFVVPVLVIRFTPGLSLRDFGLGLGDWRYSLRVFWLFMAVMLAAIAVMLVFRVGSFLKYYPMYAKGLAGLPLGGWFVLLEFLYLLYFIGWEFYFRALLLFPLEKQLGGLTPLVGVLPFAIMHLGKPVPEVFGSVLAAWFLGVLVLRTRSFWICPLLHFLIAFAMDLAAALGRGLV